MERAGWIQLPAVLASHLPQSLPRLNQCCSAVKARMKGRREGRKSSSWGVNLGWQAMPWHMQLLMLMLTLMLMLMLCTGPDVQPMRHDHHTFIRRGGAACLRLPCLRHVCGSVLLWACGRGVRGLASRETDITSHVAACSGLCVPCLCHVGVLVQLDVVGSRVAYRERLP